MECWAGWSQTPLWKVIFTGWLPPLNALLGIWLPTLPNGSQKHFGFKINSCMKSSTFCHGISSKMTDKFSRCPMEWLNALHWTLHSASLLERWRVLFIKIWTWDSEGANEMHMPAYQPPQQMLDLKCSFKKDSMKLTFLLAVPAQPRNMKKMSHFRCQIQNTCYSMGKKSIGKIIWATISLDVQCLSWSGILCDLGRAEMQSESPAIIKRRSEQNL